MKFIKNYLTEIISALQLIMSIVFVGFVVKLNILPLKYTIILSVILLLLCILVYILARPVLRGKECKRSLFGKIISVLLSICLLIASFAVVRGNSALNTITNANVQTQTFSIIVLNDSELQEVNDLANHSILVNNSVDKEITAEVVNALEDKVNSVEILETATFVDQVDLLYSQEVDAILVNEAYRGMLEDRQENFSNETRIIWEYNVEEKIEDFAKEADVTEEPFTVYISGIDTTGKVSTVSRSDVNMLVTVNPTTKQILMTSIPRDYLVPLANMGLSDKLTHAGIAGVENSVKTLENFLDIEINYYVKVNFTSLVNIVDALGGVTVNSPVSFVTLHGNYLIVAGDNYLNGEEALGFVRERYSLAGGDNDRVKNQQRLLEAIINKAISPAIITNYSSILNAVEGSFETNMKTNEITSLIKMQLSDMSGWDIKQIQLTGTGAMMTGGAYIPASTLYYMIPDQDSVNAAVALINQMMNGEDIMSEE